MRQRPPCTCKHIVSKNVVRSILNPTCPRHTTDHLTFRVTKAQLVGSEPNAQTLPRTE